MTTMDANEDKINGVVEAGRRLASDGNINSDRIQERVASIDDRSAAVAPCWLTGVLRQRPISDKMVF